MEPVNPDVHSEVLLEVLAEALGKQLLPSIPVFRDSRIGIALLEGRNIGFLLTVIRVDARAA